MRSVQQSRALPVTVGLAISLVALVVVVTPLTDAAFRDDRSAEASISGKLDVAQDADGLEQYTDPLLPKVIVHEGDGTRPVRLLPNAAPGDPITRTATWDVQIFVPRDSAPATVFFSVTNREDDASVFDHLRFGLYDGDSPIIDDGTPVTGDDIRQMNDGRGVQFDSVLRPGKGLTLTARAWLEPNSPATVFNRKVDVGFTVTAESAGGTVHQVEGSLT